MSEKIEVRLVIAGEEYCDIKPVRRMETAYEELKEENKDLNISIRKVTDERDKLEDGYLSYRTAYCKAEKERVALEKKLDMAIEALEKIKKLAEDAPQMSSDSTKEAVELSCSMDAIYSKVDNTLSKIKDQEKEQWSIG